MSNGNILCGGGRQLTMLNFNVHLIGKDSLHWIVIAAEVVDRSTNECKLINSHPKNQLIHPM